MNALSELPPKLRQTVLLIEDKVASGAMIDDAAMLASYARLQSGTVGYDDFISNAICLTFAHVGRQLSRLRDVYVRMDDDELVELRCRFCGGQLKPDTPAAPHRQVTPFRFFRCSDCDMPNVLSAPPADAKRRTQSESD